MPARRRPRRGWRAARPPRRPSPRAPPRRRRPRRPPRSPPGRAGPGRTASRSGARVVEEDGLAVALQSHVETVVGGPVLARMQGGRPVAEPAEEAVLRLRLAVADEVGAGEEVVREPPCE